MFSEFSYLIAQAINNLASPNWADILTLMVQSLGFLFIIYQYGEQKEKDRFDEVELELGKVEEKDLYNSKLNEMVKELLETIFSNIKLERYHLLRSQKIDGIISILIKNSDRYEKIFIITHLYELRYLIENISYINNINDEEIELILKIITKIDEFIERESEEETSTEESGEKTILKKIKKILKNVFLLLKESIE